MNFAQITIVVLTKQVPFDLDLIEYDLLPYYETQKEVAYNWGYSTRCVFSS